MLPYAALNTFLQLASVSISEAARDASTRVFHTEQLVHLTSGGMGGVKGWQFNLPVDVANLTSSGTNGAREVGELAASRSEGYSLDSSKSSGSREGCKDLDTSDTHT